MCVSECQKPALILSWPVSPVGCLAYAVGIFTAVHQGDDVSAAATAGAADTAEEAAAALKAAGLFLDPTRAVDSRDS